MESTSRASTASSEEAEPGQRRSKRLRRLQEDKRAKDDRESRLEYKNFLIQEASKCKPGQTTALHLWIRDATHPFKDRVAKARLLSAGDLKDVVAVAPWMTRTQSKDVRIPFMMEAYWAPVAYAASRNAKDWVFERLLSVCTGADLLVASNGVTPLYSALWRDRYFEICKFILDAAGKQAPALARNHFRYDFLSLGKQTRVFSSLNWTERDDRALHLLIDTMVSDMDNEERHPLSVTDSYGQTPLHVAALLGAGASVLKKLVALFPEALKMENSLKGTPIPLLIAADSFAETNSKESIRFLMNAWPEGVRYKDGEGRTLVHRPLPDDVLDEALKRWPEGIKCPDLLTRNGVLQMNPQHVRFILSQLSSESLAAFVATMPLHHSMQHRHRRDQERVLETVVAVVDACPDVLKRRDYNGQTPLHSSDWSGFTRGDPHSISAFMMQQDPAALYLPVKNLWCFSANWGIGVYLRNVCDQCVLESSIVGCFLPRIGYADRPTRHLAGLLRQTLVNGHGVPLLDIVASHSAGDHEAYAQTISYVHELDPQTIRQEVSEAVPQGGKGRLPLHVACAQADCRADNLQLLLDLYKPALDVADAKGLYPFMIAATNESANVECVYRLLRHWPLTFAARSNVDI